MSEALKRFHELCRWSTPNKVLEQNELVEDELDGMVWVGAYESSGSDEDIQKFAGTLRGLADIYEEMEVSWEVLRARFPELKLPDFEDV